MRTVTAPMLWISTLALAILPSPMWGATTNPPPTLRAIVALKDGSRLVGQPGVDALAVRSPQLGELKIPLDRIRSISHLAGRQAMSVDMVNGDKMELELSLSKLPLKTALGELAVPLSEIRTITFAKSGAAPSLTRGLVARWSAEDNAKDSAGKHDGQWRGAEYAPGKVGKAFRFAGGNSRVSVPDSPDFEFKGSFTVEGWIKIEVTAPGIIFMRGDSRGGLDCWVVGITADGQIACNFNSPDNETFLLTTDPPKDEWFHVAMVFDAPGERLGFYLNGKLAKDLKTKAQPIWELDPGSDPGVGLGNHAGQSHSFPFHGLLDEWGVYDRPLDVEEIQMIIERENAGEHIVPMEKQM
jgi:hypothetical protein